MSSSDDSTSSEFEEESEPLISVDREEEEADHTDEQDLELLNPFSDAYEISDNDEPEFYEAQESVQESLNDSNEIDSDSNSDCDCENLAIMNWNLSEYNAQTGEDEITFTFELDDEVASKKAKKDEAEKTEETEEIDEGAVRMRSRYGTKRYGRIFGRRGTDRNLI